MLLIASIGMTLPVSVLGLGFVAAYYGWLLLDGFPVGWGIAGVVFCLWYMGGAYKMMVFLNGQGGTRNNAAAAGCLPFAMQLLLVVYFTRTEWSSELSALWALLLIPLSFVMQLLMQAAFEALLNLVNPKGRRIEHDA
jgi:hypothetical protein